MSKFLLILQDEAENDPPTLVTEIPEWEVGQTFLTGGRGQQLQILAIETEIPEDLIEAGFDGVFTVEPV